VPISLSELCEPSTTAVVCQEMQKGIVGPISVHKDLVELAAAEAVPNTARIVERAREVGSLVVHTPTVRRPDDRGSGKNTRIFRAARKLGTPLEPGGEGVEVIDEIGLDPRDIELPRLHGMGPMHDTGLDPILRNEGITTIVATGVSVNLGILNLVLDGVNRSYQMVIVRDAVAGVPKEYSDAVIDNTLWLAGTVVTTDELLAAWAGD
jgi:nicotinamidase-related amidase